MSDDKIPGWSNIAAAQKIVRDIWATWYPDANGTPADNMTDLLHQIGNSLLGLPEYAKANESRIAATNAMNRHRRAH